MIRCVNIGQYCYRINSKIRSYKGKIKRTAKEMNDSKEYGIKADEVIPEKKSGPIAGAAIFTFFTCDR